MSGARVRVCVGVLASVWPSLSAIAVTAVVAPPQVASAAITGTGLVPIGGEVLVNEQTEGVQAQPDVAPASAGGLLVAWQDQGHVFAGAAGPTTVVAGRSIDDRGRPVPGARVLMGTAAESGVATYSNPRVRAWPSVPGIFLATAFRSPGDQLVANTHASSPAASPQPTSAGALPGQSDLGQIGSGTAGSNYALVMSNGDIVLDLLGGDGATYLNDVVVNASTGTAGLQSEPAVVGSFDAIDVAFRDGDDIRVNGLTQSGGFVRTNVVALPGVQRDPDVAALAPADAEPARPAGSVVVFVDEAGDGSGTAIRAQYFNVSGAASSVVTVNTTTAGDQTEPVVTALTDNRVFVAWTDASGTEGAGGSGTAVRGRLLAVDGAQLVTAGDELLVNTYTAGDQRSPAVATTTTGLVTVVWSSASGVLDPSGSGISAQTFDPRFQADIKVEPSTRHCFAVSGDAGDVAVVNLTPVEADSPGNGQLVSSDVGVAPVASNVNFGPGSVDPNVAVAPIGADGRVCFVNSEHANVHLIADHLATLDAAGFAPTSAGGAPRRVVDTRIGLGGGKVPRSGRVCFAGGGAVGDVAVVNLTPVEADGPGNGQLVSSDVITPPVASNVNFRPGSVDPNVAMAPIGADGNVCYVSSVHAPVHLIADLLGTVRAAGFRSAGATSAPVRVFDSRPGGASAKVAPSARVCFPVTGTPGDLAVVNLTPVEAEAPGNGQLVSSDVTAPLVASNVNFGPDSVDPNVALVPIGADGRVCYVNSVHARVHLVADHLGTVLRSAAAPASPTGGPVRAVDTRPVRLGTNVLAVVGTPMSSVACTASDCVASTRWQLPFCFDCPYAGQAISYSRSAATWETIAETPTTNENFTGLTCLASGVCLASTAQFVQSGGIFTNIGLWRSADSGRTWSKVRDSTELFGGVECASATVCLVGTDTQLLRTNDAGATWQPVGVASALSGIECPTADVCFALSAGSVVRSGDAGLTWTPVSAEPTLRQLACSSALVCSGVATDRAFLRSVDGGTTWTRTSQPARQSPTGVWCAGSNCLANVAYSGPVETTDPGGWRMLFSADAGVTWEPALVPTGHPFAPQLADVTCTANECALAGGTGTGYGWVTIVSFG